MVFHQQSLTVKQEMSIDIMSIDYATAKYLELVQSAVDGQVSLMSVLDHCQTRTGRIKLRVSILQPLNDQQKIEQRQAAVKELQQSD